MNRKLLVILLLVIVVLSSTACTRGHVFCDTDVQICRM